jgi:DNA-binding CsgD family transcriptional regulator
MKQLKTQYLNYLSLEVLEKLGNKKPTQKQIDLMTTILTNVSIVSSLVFDQQLSKCETSCLYWAAMGKTEKETAELLNINSYTVQQHRQTVIKKLHCKSLAEAIFKGMRFVGLQSNG